LVAEALSAQGVRARRQRLRREAARKGRPIVAARWEACSWTVLVTNAPAAPLTAVVGSGAAPRHIGQFGRFYGDEAEKSMPGKAQAV
jgi:hypothetical protein